MKFFIYLIFPALLLSSCTINGNDKKDKTTGDQYPTEISSAGENSNIQLLKKDFGNDISLIQSGSSILLDIHGKIIKNWELDARDDIFTQPNATQKIQENLTIIQTNDPNFVTIYLKQNNFTYQYLYYNHNQSWIIDINKAMAYTTYSIITNIEKLSGGYLVQENDISSGSGFLAFYHKDWSSIQGNGFDDVMPPETQDIDHVFEKICQAPTNSIFNIANLLGTRYGFLKHIGNTLIFFQNPDGPLYQYQDYGIEKRIGYESFQSYDCKKHTTTILLKDSSMKKIESSLPKKEKLSHLYIPNIGDYTFSGGVLKFAYGLYVPAHEGPDYEIKNYNVLIDTYKHTATMELKDEGFKRKIDL